MSVYFGFIHLRILSIGEYVFYEPLPTQTIRNGFFSGLEASPRQQRVQEQIESALARFAAKTVFFGPRLEFEYAVLQRPVMLGMPLLWDSGVSFSPDRLPQMIADLKHQDPQVLVFLKYDYTRMGAMSDYIKSNPIYERDDSYEDLTVYVRKRLADSAQPTGGLPTQ